MNIKKTIWLAALMALFPFFLHAQGHFDWVKSYSGPDKPGDDVANRIIQTETDSEGNLYVMCECSASAGINGVPLVDHPELSPYDNVIIMKIEPTGDIVWKKSISSNPYKSEGLGIRLVGDTTVVCLVIVPLVENRLYFIDSLYTDPRSQLLGLDSTYQSFGAVYVSLNNNGDLLEQHIVEISGIDNHGDLITMDRVRLQPRYEGHVLPWFGTSWCFDIDHDGNIIILRSAEDFTDIKTGAIDSMGYNIMERYSIENGLLSGLRIWVDGHGRCDIYPQNQPKMWNLMLMKFSPHFDDLLGYQYLFSDEQGDPDDFLHTPHDLYIDSIGNIYLIDNLRKFHYADPHSARLTGTSQFINLQNSSNGVLIKCDSALNPIY